jgi:integrase
MGPTKTKEIRTVRLSDDVVASLTKLKRKMAELDLCRGKPTEAVFVGHHGFRRLHISQLHVHWTKCLKGVGSAHYAVYDLRHTFASQLLSRGESIVVVAAALGHRNPNMTLRSYAHLMPDRMYPDLSSLASPNRKSA